MREAMHYEKAAGGVVCCSLCPHRCRISPGRVGMCGVRKNIDGKLYSINYARVSSWAMDPIEKKAPLSLLPGKLDLFRLAA